MSTLHELNPERAHENWVKADAARYKGQTQEALDLLWEIVDPDHGLQPSMVKAYWLAAEIHLSNGDPDQALDVLKLYKMPTRKKGEDLPKEELQTLFYKARSLFEKGDYEDCRAVLSIIEEHDHKNLEAVQLRADLHLETNDTGKAIQIYLSLLNRDFNTKAVMYSLAQAYYSAKNYAMANHYVTKLKEMGVVDKGVESFFRDTQRMIYNESIRKDPTIPWLDKFIMRIFPIYAAQKIMQYTQRKIIEEKTQETKYTDNLTGLYTKDAVDSYLTNFFHKAKNRFFVGRGDLDFFKSINDVHGHDVGDKVLAVFGKILQEYFPARAFRMGGDEFLWAFDGEESDCIERAKAFRKALEERAKEMINTELLKNPVREVGSDEMIFMNWNVTCSQGIAEWTKEMNLDKVKAEADANQYEAKLPQVGRNAIFYKSKPVEKGTKPIPYTAVMVKHLNSFAKEKGYGNWWKFLEANPKTEVIQEGLDVGKKKEDEEKKLQMEKSL